jgi:Zn-dependent protease with chaperone function
VMTLFQSYGVVVYPLIVFTRTLKYEKNVKLEQLLYEITSERVQIRLINSNLINAFATGVIPFTKLIMVGKPMVEKLTENELKCIILHELGHIKRKHILVLTILVILLQTCFFVFYDKLFIPWWSANYADLKWIKWTGFVILNLAVFEIIWLYNKRMEYSADSYAAVLAGKLEYANTLKKLDLITDGMLSRKTNTHPTLNQRIENVSRLQ